MPLEIIPKNFHFRTESRVRNRHFFHRFSERRSRAFRITKKRLGCRIHDPERRDREVD